MHASAVDPEKEATAVDTGSSAAVAPNALDFPEGGLRGWATVFGAALVQFATFGYINAYGVYQDFYVREYMTDYAPSTLGWIGGIQICLVFACGIVTGRAFDRGYFYHMMIGGSVLHAFSFFMLSLSHENKYYQVFLSQGLGGGLAAGITYIPTLTVPSHYFQRNRAAAMGVVASGSALGAVIHPIMLNRLFHGHIGFHNGVRISAAFNTALLIIAVAMMRTRLPPKKTGSRLPVIEFMRDPPYLFVVLAGMLFICGFFFPPFYLQLDAIQHGVDPKFAFYLLSIMNAASFVGRILLPMLCPRFGAFNLIIFVTCSMAITLFCHGVLKDLRGFATIAVFFGFFSGAGIALTPPILTSLAKDMSEFGARIGIQFTAAGILGLIASPILGALVTSQLRWWRPVIFSGSTMLASGVFFAIGRHLVSRRKGTQIL